MKRKWLVTTAMLAVIAGVSMPSAFPSAHAAVSGAASTAGTGIKAPETSDGDGETANDQKQDAANQAELAKSEKLTPAEAQKIAQKEVPGKVLETDLDKIDGTVVYDVVIYDGTTVKEITLNASSGVVLKVAIDDEAEQKLEQLKDAAIQAELAKSAKLTPAEAQKIAQKEVPGKVLETDLDKNGGTVVYDVVIYDGTTVKEVTLNANSGVVIKVAIDDEAEQKLKQIKKS